jgi:hypothetical protein
MAEESAEQRQRSHKPQFNEKDAAWAIRYAGGLKRVRRGIRFDEMPIGTVLENAAMGWAAMKRGPKSWKIDHAGVPLDYRDLRDYYMDGLLQVRTLGDPQVTSMSRHAQIPATLSA